MCSPCYLPFGTLSQYILISYYHSVLVAADEVEKSAFIAMCLSRYLPFGTLFQYILISYYHSFRVAADEVEKSAFIAMCLGRKKELGQEVWTDAIKAKMTETMDKLPTK